MFEERNACRVKRWKSKKGKRSLGRFKRRWEDNVKMDFRAVGWGGMV